MTEIQLDIISDVMCPWCIVGYRQLQLALDATGTEHEIHWHPFELNPDMPPEGQDMQEAIAVMLERYQPDNPDHPMTLVLQEGQQTASAPRRP